MISEHFCIRCGDPYFAPEPGLGLCPDCTCLLSGQEPASRPPEPAEQVPVSVPPRIPASIEWQAGDVLLGTYEVKGLLGEGGMGRVYRMHHKSWNLDLAVKRPKPEIFSKQRGKEDFIREVETWIELGLHPHICSCHYVRTLGDVPRLFAECVEGGSLESWIESRRLQPESVRRKLEEMTKGKS